MFTFIRKPVNPSLGIDHNFDEVIVTVSDNSEGIPEGVPDYSSRTNTVSVGIAGMREGMEHLGGGLEIEASRSGTKVEARVPRRHFREAAQAANV
jgi:signal transduction histidine kinase